MFWVSFRTTHMLPNPKYTEMNKLRTPEARGTRIQKENRKKAYLEKVSEEGGWKREVL